MNKAADKIKNDVKVCSSIKAKLMLGGIITTEKLADRIKQDPGVESVSNNFYSISIVTNDKCKPCKNKLDVTMYEKMNRCIHQILDDEKDKVNSLLDKNEIVYYNSENNSSSANLFYTLNTTKRGLILNI